MNAAPSRGGRGVGCRAIAATACARASSSAPSSPAGQAARLLLAQLLALVGAAVEDALDLVGGKPPQPLRVGPACRDEREAVLAEAEAEQEAGARTQVEEVALVVVAVLQRVVVQGLGDDRAARRARRCHRSEPARRRRRPGWRGRAPSASGRRTRCARRLRQRLVHPVDMEVHRPGVDARPRRPPASTRSARASPSATSRLTRGWRARPR